MKHLALLSLPCSVEAAFNIKKKKKKTGSPYIALTVLELTL
jgi:hypothetical protein